MDRGADEIAQSRTAGCGPHEGIIAAVREVAVAGAVLVNTFGSVRRMCLHLR